MMQSIGSGAGKWCRYAADSGDQSRGGSRGGSLGAREPPPLVLNDGLFLTHTHYGVEFDEDQVIPECARKQPRRMELVDIFQ